MTIQWLLSFFNKFHDFSKSRKQKTIFHDFSRPREPCIILDIITLTIFVPILAVEGLIGGRNLGLARLQFNNKKYKLYHIGKYQMHWPPKWVILVIFQDMYLIYKFNFYQKQTNKQITKQYKKQKQTKNLCTSENCEKDCSNLKQNPPKRALFFQTKWPLVISKVWSLSHTSHSKSEYPLSLTLA